MEDTHQTYMDMFAGVASDVADVQQDDVDNSLVWNRQRQTQPWRVSFCIVASCLQGGHLSEKYGSYKNLTAVWGKIEDLTNSRELSGENVVGETCKLKFTFGAVLLVSGIVLYLRWLYLRWSIFWKILIAVFLCCRCALSGQLQHWEKCHGRLESGKCQFHMRGEWSPYVSCSVATDRLATCCCRYVEALKQHISSLPAYTDITLTVRLPGMWLVEVDFLAEVAASYSYRSICGREVAVLTPGFLSYLQQIHSVSVKLYVAVEMFDDLSMLGTLYSISLI